MLLPMTGPLEAILFAAGGDGLSVAEIAAILQLSVDEAADMCDVLCQSYDDREAGLMMVELAGRWVLGTRTRYADYLRQMAASPASPGLSNAALEVLAIVAYKQPVSRLDIDEIRGVQSDRSLATLVHRRMVAEVGRQEAPGRPILYGTTAEFLQTFGLNSLGDLPPLPEESDSIDGLPLFRLDPTLPRD